MRFTLFQKLFLSLLTSSLLLLAGMAYLINSSFKEGLQSYLNQEELTKVESLASNVSSYYSETYGWDKLLRSPQVLATLMQQIGEAPPPRPRRGPPPRHDRLSPDTLPPSSKLEREQALFVPLGVRISLLDESRTPLLGPMSRDFILDESLQFVSYVPIKHDDNTIGWLSVVQSRSVSNKLAESFIQSQTTHVLTISLAALLLTLTIAFFSVRYLLKPLSALHHGAVVVGSGQLDHRIDHTGSDELADLVDAFNQLTASLEHQKQLRDQWLSDISHELRTPVAVLKGEIEALQDGIRPLEMRYVDGLHDQVSTLTRLINDLHTLALSDSGAKDSDQRDAVTLVDVLSPIVERYELRLKEKSISLEHQLEGNPEIEVFADSKSLQQVFQNLFENCFRYTDENGSVRLSIQESKTEATIIIEDSYPSVPTQALPKLFERLYRVDKSRSRANGGSGLGLAICQSIVKAHNGSLNAEHSPLGGLKMVVTLPKPSNDEQ